MEHLILIVSLLIIGYIFYKEVLFAEWTSSNSYNKNDINNKIDSIIERYKEKNETVVNIKGNNTDIEWVLLMIKRAILNGDKVKIKEIMDKVVEKYWYDILKKIWPTIVKMTAVKFRREDVTFIWISILHYGQH